MHKHIQVCKQFILKNGISWDLCRSCKWCMDTRARTNTHLYTQPDAHIAVLMGWGTVRLSCIRLEDEMVHMGATHQTHTHTGHCHKPMCVLLTVLSRGCAGCPHCQCSLLDWARAEPTAGEPSWPSHSRVLCLESLFLLLSLSFSGLNAVFPIRLPPCPFLLHLYYSSDPPTRLSLK